MQATSQRAHVAQVQPWTKSSQATANMGNPVTATIQVAKLIGTCWTRCLPEFKARFIPITEVLLSRNMSHGLIFHSAESHGQA